MVPTLPEESFNSALIDTGINDILKDESNLKFESLTRNILEISQNCKEHGIEEIIISPLVVTDRIDQNLLARANASLYNMCRENGFCFVDNSNISVDNLFKDKLHLLDSGKTILANNFIYCINNLERKECTDLQIMYENRLKHPRNPFKGYLNINYL